MLKRFAVLVGGACAIASLGGCAAVSVASAAVTVASTAVGVGVTAGSMAVGAATTVVKGAASLAGSGDDASDGKR